jgi:VWFA-related protein
MKRLSICVLALVTGAAAAVLTATEVPRRNVRVIVTDKAGVPMTDLTDADLVVTEDKHTVAPITVSPSAAPVQLAFVVDDHGLGIPELPVAAPAFARAMAANGSVGLFSTARAEATLVNFSSDAAALDAGIIALAQPVDPATTTGMSVSRLLVALAQQFQRRSAPRPVIVVVTKSVDCGHLTADQGIEERNLDPYRVEFRRAASNSECVNYPYAPRDTAGVPPHDQVIRALQASGTTVFAVDTRGAASAPMPGRTVLAPTTNPTGGRVLTALTDAALSEALMTVAREIQSQYVVSYDVSTVSDVGAKLRIEVKRPGAVVHAPDRVGVR